MINLEDRPTLDRWLRLLPGEQIQLRPDLLMLKVWAAQFSWRLDLQAQMLQQVEELLELDRAASMTMEEQQILRGQILALKAQQAYFSNQPSQAIEHCRQALALLPPAWTFVRGGAILYLGMSMQASGQPQEAERLMLDEYEAGSDKTNIYSLHVLHSLAFIYLNTGQLEQARRIAQVMLQAATQSNVTIKKNWADWFLGMVDYQHNELDAAAQHFTRIVVNPYIAQITTYRDAVAGLALIHQIKGESSEAWHMVESISQFDLEQGGREDTRTRSLRARLQLLQGELEGAGIWADTFTGPPPDQPLMWLEEPQVTRARLLLERGTDADLELALQILEALDEIAERTHNIRYKIEILALRALALDGQGQSRGSQRCPETGAGPGAPGRLHPGLPGFRQAHVRAAAPDCGSESFGGCDPAPPGRLPGRGAGSAGRRPAGEDDGRSIDLQSDTDRAPYSARARDPEFTARVEGVKEIALALHLSPATVKRHINNIYAKLGVNKRWHAVARAEELNILPPR